jgi:DNA-binding NtrC family response regulator
MEAASGATPQREASPAHRILVVDDEASIRLSVTCMLGRSGYHVDTAENGADAWEALQAKHYDLLITDNNMPKVSGVELLQRLHAHRKPLAVIMATGALPNENFTQSPWLQPFATLLKPFTMVELLEKVQAFLPERDGTRERIHVEPILECQASS